MSVEERDPVSGYLTTGHDWNGIKELNSPVPRIVFAFMVVTHLYALVAWFLHWLPLRLQYNQTWIALLLPVHLALAYVFMPRRLSR